MTLSTEPGETTPDDNTLDATIEKIVAELSQIDTDLDAHTIKGRGNIKTVNQMIDHITRKTPEGLHFIELHLRAHELMAEMDAEEQAARQQGIIAKIRRIIKKLLNKTD